MKGVRTGPCCDRKRQGNATGKDRTLQRKSPNKPNNHGGPKGGKGGGRKCNWVEQIKGRGGVEEEETSSPDSGRKKRLD